MVFPDDDGKLQRAWERNPERRGIVACERVYEVMCQRPWVTGDILVTVANSIDDVRGYDLFLPMDERLVQTLGICEKKCGVPVQVKSSDHAVKEFLRSRRIMKSGELVFTEGEYIFTFNGHQSKDLIVADMVGQMLLLTRDYMNEANFLDYLSDGMGDTDAVERWIDNREIILGEWWYKDLI